MTDGTIGPPNREIHLEALVSIDRGRTDQSKIRIAILDAPQNHDLQADVAGVLHELINTDMRAKAMTVEVHDNRRAESRPKPPAPLDVGAMVRGWLNEHASELPYTVPALAPVTPSEEARRNAAPSDPRNEPGEDSLETVEESIEALKATRARLLAPLREDGIEGTRKRDAAEGFRPLNHDVPPAGALEQLVAAVSTPAGLWTAIVTAAIAAVGSAWILWT